MMGVWFAVGALLLVMLSGASYSYPVKIGRDPDITSSSGYFKSPADSYWEVPSAVFVPVSSDSWFAPNSDHPESSAESGSAGGSYSSAYPASAYSGYSSDSHADLTQPSFQLGLNQDFSWAVMPPSPQSDKFPPPSAPMFASEPELLSYSYVGAPDPLPPVFQKGELSRVERAFEHGNSESETETQGFGSYPDAEGFNEDFSDPLASDLDGLWSAYPLLDYMLFTGKYPPGTVTHYSTSFEQGSEQTHDTHYIKDHPASSDPDDLTQPSQSAQQYHSSWLH
ncbi:uncharacterized protein LOC102078915 isoform X1 [Oreochromis niloticus]|uniref:uncharacterized protein LOC102078915 isoform X1 n=1 Tax=Oreochromis niloticus TaxID=8128 RepID=UPI000674D59C|nr:uncharacterized protein LOC102078915 isoform X1 [Oreochromis niloticus]